jgi:hypothetical protein
MGSAKSDPLGDYPVLSRMPRCSNRSRIATTVPAAPAPRPALGPLRLAQLVADLRLTPEQRVREAERTARASRPRNSVHIQGAIGFDDLNDYLAWKRLEELGG